MLPRKRVTTHPGEVLQEEFLKPLRISQNALARHIGVRAFAINDLVHAKRRVTPRMALMLSQALGTSVEFWMGLQDDYDITRLTQTGEGKRVQAIPPMAHAG